MGRKNQGLSEKYKSEYWAWSSMKQRCDNPKCSAYKNYGARGIGYCPSWATFKQFIADLGAKPTKNHTLERVDNNSGYSKHNCIWATSKVQNNNSRNTRFITAFGVTKTLSEWAKEYNVPVSTLANRLDRFGYPIEMALIKKRHKPVKSRKED